MNTTFDELNSIIELANSWLRGSGKVRGLFSNRDDFAIIEVRVFATCLWHFLAAGRRAAVTSGHAYGLRVCSAACSFDYEVTVRKELDCWRIVEVYARLCMLLAKEACAFARITRRTLGAPSGFLVASDDVQDSLLLTNRLRSDLLAAMRMDGCLVKVPVSRRWRWRGRDSEAT